jgi:hypothetical protein
MRGMSATPTLAAVQSLLDELDVELDDDELEELDELLVDAESLLVLDEPDEELDDPESVLLELDELSDDEPLDDAVRDDEPRLSVL